MFLRVCRRLPLDDAQKTHIFFFDEPFRELHLKFKTSKNQPTFFVAVIFIFSNKKNRQLRQISSEQAEALRTSRRSRPLKSSPFNRLQQSQRPLKPARQAVKEKNFQQNRRFYEVIACLKRASKLSLRR
jgi:hypothetical protein